MRYGANVLIVGLLLTAGLVFCSIARVAADQVDSLTPPSTDQIAGLTPPSTDQIAGDTPPSTDQVGGDTPPSTDPVGGDTPPSTDPVDNLTSPSTDPVDNLTSPSGDTDDNDASETSPPPVASAVSVPGRAVLPDGVLGTDTWHERRGYKITVGFSPCGHDEDPLAQYYARIVRRHEATELWAHSPRRINEVMLDLYGFGLTPEAVAVLQNDAATYPC